MELPDSEVRIKMSICPNCKGFFAAAVEHKMNDKMKRDFGKEVMKYNLDVITITLQQYRDENKPYCKCE